MLLNTTGNCCKRKYFNNISPLLYRLIIIFPLHNSVVQDDVTARRNHTVKIIAADPRTSDFHFSSKHWSPSIPFLYYSNGCSTKTYSLQETNWHFKTCLGGKRNTFSCGHCTIQNASWAEICRHLNRRNLRSQSNKQIGFETVNAVVFMLGWHVSVAAAKWTGTVCWSRELQLQLSWKFTCY